MALILHVIIALTSMVYTTYLFVRPSRAKFYAAYALVALTLTSGTYLVVSTHARLVPSCEAGLAYLGVVLSGLVAAHHRLVGAASLNAQAPVGMRAKDHQHKQ